MTVIIYIMDELRVSIAWAHGHGSHHFKDRVFLKTDPFLCQLSLGHFIKFEFKPLTISLAKNYLGKPLFSYNVKQILLNGLFVQVCNSFKKGLGCKLWLRDIERTINGNSYNRNKWCHIFAAFFEDLYWFSNENKNLQACLLLKYHMRTLLKLCNTLTPIAWLICMYLYAIELNHGFFSHHITH